MPTQKNRERLKKIGAPKGLTNRNQGRSIHFGVNNTFAEETLSHGKKFFKRKKYPKVSFRLSPSILEKLNNLAEKNHIKRSVLLRTFTVEGLNKRGR